jgi:hypothetical protein
MQRDIAAVAATEVADINAVAAHFTHCHRAVGVAGWLTLFFSC